MSRRRLFLALSCSLLYVLYRLRGRSSLGLVSSVTRWADYYRRQSDPTMAKSPSTGFLTQAQLDTLRAIVDTYFSSVRSIPSAAVALSSGRLTPSDLSDYFARRGTDFRLDEEIVELLRSFASTSAVDSIKLLLTLLSHRLVVFLFTWRFSTFSGLSAADREALFQKWSTSKIKPLRDAAFAFKRLTCQLALAVIDEKSGRNPNWSAVNYPGPEKFDSFPFEKPTIEPLQLECSVELNCDALVIGSGCGGGVVAGELSSAGLDVLVVEKGHFVPDEQFQNTEAHAFPNLYEQAGTASTSNNSISILAGSCLGGGSVVNWSASFKTPDHVRQEWAKQFGLKALEPQSKEFSDALESIWVKNSSQPNRQHNVQNSLLIAGCQKLGYHVNNIPRNCIMDTESGFSCLGDKYGNKQSTLKTWLKDAAKLGARFLVDCHIDSLLFDSKQQKCVGALGHFLSPHSKQIHSVKINANIVVVSAGSLHSPAILLRSGLKNPNIGRHLRFHPVSPVAAVFDQPVRSWTGDNMTVVSDQFANQDGNHYGVKIEVPPVHAGVFSGFSPWDNAAQWKTDILKFDRASFLVILTRDSGSGSVTIDSNGEPVWAYDISEKDFRHLLNGMIGGARIFEAAGAREVQFMIPGAERLEFPVGASASDRKAMLQKWIDNMERRLKEMPHLKPTLFTAHQMGTCRMASSPASGVCNESGQVWGVENLYVADASLFPTASGANPMCTTMGLAYFVSQRIIRSVRGRNYKSPNHKESLTAKPKL